MNAKLVKTDPAIKARARDLYFQWYEHNTICKELGITSALLAKWRTEEGWAKERQAADEGMISDLFAGRKVKMAKLAEMSLTELERGLSALKSRHEPLTLGEMEKLSVILTNLDRITRLDLNRATDHVAMKLDVQGQLSVERIREIVRSDPFLSEEPSPDA